MTRLRPPTPARGLPLALARDRSGASALVTSLALVAVLGFAGLGLDVGSWYNLRRTAQHAADSAAFSGATAMGAGDDAVSHARAVAAVYGVQHGVSGATVTVNSPPVSGAYRSDVAAVEVIVARPAPRFLSGLFLKSSPTIRARAVGRAGAPADACVLAFNTIAAGSLQIGGQPNVKLNGCSAYINSSNSSALSMNGSAVLTAESVQLVGGYSTSGQATINATNGVTTGAKPLSDPYADVALPAYEALACTAVPAMNSGASIRFSPSPGGNIRRFCGDLSINGGATVNFDPGIYILDRGRFTINSSAVVRGTGVTFVLTSSTGSNYATLTINGGADVRLSAPTSGPTAGLVFYQDRRAPSDTNTINGGSTTVFGGALYFPKQFVRFNGGAESGGGCTQLLADTIEFNGNARFDINCEGTGVRLGAGGKTQLVE